MGKPVQHRLWRATALEAGGFLMGVSHFLQGTGQSWEKVLPWALSAVSPVLSVRSAPCSALVSGGERTAGAGTTPCQTHREAAGRHGLGACRGVPVRHLGGRGQQSCGRPVCQSSPCKLEESR